VNPQGPEAEGDPAVPAIVAVAPGIGPTVTSAIERRPSVSSAIDPAAVTNSWLKSPNAPVTLQHALPTIEEQALAAPILGFGGGGSHRRRDGEGGDGGEQ
jgi:hypothetical protein